MKRRTYYMTVGKFSNLCTLFFVHDAADVHALKELVKRGTIIERITRERALVRARMTRGRGRIYKCTSLFAYDKETNFGNEVTYMDARGKMH